MLAECLEALGGMLSRVLADRMGCLKGGVVANVVLPTGEYVRSEITARDASSSPRPCRCCGATTRALMCQRPGLRCRRPGLRCRPL
jgi:hypothetical protein